MRYSLLFAIACVFPLEYMIAGGQLFAEDQENVFQECNRTIRENGGIIVSPNFTSGYQENLHCSWTIIVEPGMIVTLTFWYFDVERGINCQNDRVSVFNGPSQDFPLLGKFCGPFRPGPQVTTSNKMHIVMATDSSNQKRGFYASFSSEVPVVATEDSCGGLLNAPKGSFHSPNYGDSNYPSSVSCSWHIHVPGSQLIRVTFKDFDLENSLGCKFDALVLNTGSISSGGNRHDQRLCGGIDSLPEEFVSEGEELFITFISDASGFGRGFVANYFSESHPQREISTPPATTVETTTSRSATSTTSPAAAEPQCPRQCPKVKPKSRICSSNSAIAVRIVDRDVINDGEAVTVSVVKAFKTVSPSQPTSIQLRLLCPSCYKINRAGTYIVIGNIVGNGLVIRPGDYVSKYKERKHTKLATKWIRNCNGRRRRRRRRGNNRYKS